MESDLADKDGEHLPIQKIYAALAVDEGRNTLIFDDAVPVLRRMSGKRIRGYESLGYAVESPAAAPLLEVAGG